MLKKIEGFGALASFAEPVEGFDVIGVSKVVMLMGSCVRGSDLRVSLVVEPSVAAGDDGIGGVWMPCVLQIGLKWEGMRQEFG